MKAARARDLIVDGDFEGNKISRHSLKRSVGRACLIKAVRARDPLLHADLYYGDFPVNDVSQHARRRCRERRLPLEALSGHQRGVRTVFAPNGTVLTVISKIQKPTFLRGVCVPGLFRDKYHFGAGAAGAAGAGAAGAGAAGAGADGIAARVDATGRVGHVVGKGGSKINRAMRESAEVVKVDVTGYEGLVIGKRGSNLLQLQSKFDVRINIDGGAACIFPGRNAAAADVEGARAAIEAAVQAAASQRAKQEKKAERAKPKVNLPYPSHIPARTPWGDPGIYLACLPTQNIRPSHPPSTSRWARPAPPRRPGPGRRAPLPASWKFIEGGSLMASVMALGRCLHS